jgi:hypothetical protein
MGGNQNLTQVLRKRNENCADYPSEVVDIHKKGGRQP